MVNKDIYSMSNHSVAKEIGRRIDQLRLERDITQQQIADELGITVKTYRNAIGGKGKFETIIGILRIMDSLELVDAFVPEVSFSPMSLLKMQGKQRRRASNTSKVSNSATTPEGDLGW